MKIHILNINMRYIIFMRAFGMKIGEFASACGKDLAGKGGNYG